MSNRELFCIQSLNANKLLNNLTEFYLREKSTAHQNLLSKESFIFEAFITDNHNLETVKSINQPQNPRLSFITRVS